MDSRTLGLSLFVVFLMAGSGATVFVLTESDNTDNEEPIQEIVEKEDENNPPKLVLSDSFKHLWNGNNATIEGFVYDENLESSNVFINILDDQINPVISYNISLDNSGLWTIETPLSDPGIWIIDAKAYDEVGSQSNSVTSSIEIVKPVEPEANITFAWEEPAQNESIGTLRGVILHNYPQTCNLEYRPDGQNPAMFVTAEDISSIGLYALTIDTSTHNTDGLLFVTCGMFTLSEVSVDVTLPMPPEPVGDLDGDAVLDDVDDCPSTPEGEPVYSTGCSDSETDDDDDGIMNDMDICPMTQLGKSVDNNGCSESQKDDDNDGLTNDLDLCPNTPENEAIDTQGCAESQKDDDSDGVSNNLDECPETPTGEQVNAVGCSDSQIGPQQPLKILALHGGGETANGLRNQQGMQHLMNTLSEFEFVFASTPESNNVWIKDPPGGKGEPTTDRNWADRSISYLDQIVEEQGPFYAILGYSQGAAMIPVYLANTDNTFNRVMMYNGYLPTTHEGLIDTINEVAPFTVPAMVFSGENDVNFKDLAPALAQKFSNSLDVHSQTADHHLPYNTDSKYNQIINWIRDGLN